MIKRFRGKSVHKVDSKGRVSIPAPFRRVLEEGDPDWTPGTNPAFVLVWGRTGDRCLEGYSIKSMDDVDEMVSDLPRYSSDRETLERILNTQSAYAQVDENGRIVLSAELREMINVSDEVAFAGTGDNFQIWQPAALDEDTRRIKQALVDGGKENDPFALLDRARPGA